MLLSPNVSDSLEDTFSTRPSGSTQNSRCSCHPESRRVRPLVGALCGQGGWNCLCVDVPPASALSSSQTAHATAHNTRLNMKPDAAHPHGAATMLGTGSYEPSGALG
jgi:hypothetical protein